MYYDSKGEHQWDVLWEVAFNLSTSGSVPWLGWITHMGLPWALVRRMRETLTMSLKQHFWLITLDIEVNDSRVPVYR